MRIVDLLSPDKIALGATAADKGAAIDLLVGLQAKSGCLTDKEGYHLPSRGASFHPKCDPGC